MAGKDDISFLVLPNSHHDKQYFEQLALGLREARLRALKTNPESFSSLYAEELRQPTDFWTGRLGNPKARHLIAVKGKLPAQLEQSAIPSQGLLQFKCAGTLVLLGYVAVDPKEYNNDSSWLVFVKDNGRVNDTKVTRQAPVLEYHIVGVWVAPEARRKGVGSGMIQKAIDTIKQEGHDQNAKGAIVTLGVRDSDDGFAAKKLYESMGFSTVSEDCYRTNDGLDVRDFVMRRDVDFN